MHPYWKRGNQIVSFAYDIILYPKIPQDVTKKTLKADKCIKKITGYKIKTQKSAVFLYTNNELAEKEIKKVISYIIAMKNT